MEPLFYFAMFSLAVSILAFELSVEIRMRKHSRLLEEIKNLLEKIPK